MTLTAAAVSGYSVPAAEKEAVGMQARNFEADAATSAVFFRP